MASLQGFPGNLPGLNSLSSVSTSSAIKGIPGLTTLQLLQQAKTKESMAKNLIIRAWRERWTDVQWGIQIREVADLDEDGSFISDCILQQALNGPGPNLLVLSYLKHSVFSQIISSAAVLRSISLYEAYHKPFCITSLLDLLDIIKSHVITNHNADDAGKCIKLAVTIVGIVNWLLSCMYSSLENLSDMSASDSTSVELEDSKIVVKCRNLLEFFLSGPFLNELLCVGIAEEHGKHGTYKNIKRMSREIGKFSDGPHQQNISAVMMLIDQLSPRGVELKVPKSTQLVNSIDGKRTQVVNACIQSTIMVTALLRSSKDIPKVAKDLLIIKQLMNLSTTDLFCDIIHASMIGLVDSIGKECELKFIGFTFLQLPALLSALMESAGASVEDFTKGIDSFLTNESTLDIVDSKFHCSTLELFLTSLQKNSLINETHKKAFMTKKGSSQPPSPTKQNSGNVVLMLKAEATLLSVFKTLDGDYWKNQVRTGLILDAILSVLSDMLGKSFELILTAASATGRLQQVTSRLMKLNQFSRQVNGEGSKASTTRAIIFDVSFLMLCHIVQNYGAESLDAEDPDCFFEDWYRDCMVEENVGKNPDVILARCDQSKVDLLLNQYLQGDIELKTSLVFWHELCTNAVGVVHDLLVAWENDAVNFADVKKILDVFRSRICSLPVSIAAWLCAYIQIMPEQQCGKARYILNHFLNPFPSEEAQDNFKERYATMTKIITKMMHCIQPSTVPVGQPECILENKTSAELFRKCWECLSSRGIADVETTLNLKNLIDICGASHFVTICVHEILEVQHLVDLAQWRDMILGIFHLNLTKCCQALMSQVLPTLLHFSNQDSSFVEPQISTLVSLVVDATLSYYLHTKTSSVKEEPGSGATDDEPQSKKRKLSTGALSRKSSVEATEMELQLKKLYDDFSHVLKMNKSGSKPQVLFIFKFLEELSMKTPSLSLLHLLPPQTISQLTSLMSKEMSPKLLLRLYSLTEKNGRLNCAKAICNLKVAQKRNDCQLVSLE